MKWVIVRPGGLSNKTATEVGNIVVRGEDQLFGRQSDPGAPHALRSEISEHVGPDYASLPKAGLRCSTVSWI